MAKRKRVDIAKRIVPVEDAEPYVKMLAYGRHGSGKTRFAATAPRPLIIDINEKGTRSARNIKGAQVFHARNWEDVGHAYWWLKTAEHDRETVVLDTITGMQHLCMRFVLGEQEDRDPTREPTMPDRRTWGKLSELMKPQVWNFRNLPMHVIFVAQERIMGDEEEETVMYVPDLSPGSRGVAMGAVDVIGRMYQTETRKADKKTKKERRVWETRMLVGPHDQYESKDRTGALPRIVRNPTVPMILDAAFSTEEE